MKKLSTLCLVVLVLAAASCLPSTSWGKDGGDERFVPIIEWQCYTCDKQFFTFDPDDISGGGNNGNNKDMAYQQQNWRLLSNVGTPIPKCSKVKDGGHFFDKKRTMNTSPYVIYQRKNDYIVLKNGGSIKAKLGQWKCVLCGLEGFNFVGDDLDLMGANDLTKPMKLLNMAGGGQIRDCGFKAGNGALYRFHAGIKQLSTENPRSIKVAENLSRLWFSD